MKPAFFLWILSAPVLAGILITVLLLIPSIQPHLGVWIVGACAVSLGVTIPFSRVVGRFLEN